MPGTPGVTFKVWVDGTEKPEAEQYTPTAGAQVELKATPDGLIADDLKNLVWTRDGNAVPNPSVSADKLTLTLASFQDADAGLYAVEVAGKPYEGARLAKPQADDGGDDGGDGPKAPLELEVGVYDQRFAFTTGLVMSLFAAFLVLCAAGALLVLGFVAVATYMERMVLVMSVLATAAGITAVLFGVWMGGLETRGRLVATPGTPEEERRGGLSMSDWLKEGNVLVRTLTVARGTIAVLVAGAVLVITSVVASSLVLTRTSATDTPTTDTTTSPTETPTTGTTTSPTDSPTGAGSGTETSGSTTTP